MFGPGWWGSSRIYNSTAIMLSYVMFSYVIWGKIFVVLTTAKHFSHDLLLVWPHRGTWRRMRLFRTASKTLSHVSTSLAQSHSSMREEKERRGRTLTKTTMTTTTHCLTGIYVSASTCFYTSQDSVEDDVHPFSVNKWLHTGRKCVATKKGHYNQRWRRWGGPSWFHWRWWQAYTLIVHDVEVFILSDPLRPERQIHAFHTHDA